jgi:hypothetical protein
MITVAQTDGVKKQPPAAKEAAPAKVARSVEPEDDVVEEPVKRTAKKAEPPVQAKANLADVVSKWSEDE